MLPACQERTQATLDIATDLDCAEVTETAISVGVFDQIERTRAITTTPGCQGAEALEIGTLAVVPNDAKDAAWGTRIVTARNAEVSTCVPPQYGPHCIVARRDTRFIDGRGFSVPIIMRETCLGVLCPDDETCVDGVCRDATVDPEVCVTGEGCGEESLPAPEVFAWSRSIGGRGEDLPNDLARVPGGDVVVVGSFNESVDFGGGPLTAGGGDDLFVARLGPGGEYRWAKGLGGDGFDTALGVHVSAVSVLLVTGTFSGEVDFGSAALKESPGSTGGDGYVVAFGGLGIPYWALALEGPGREAAIDAATDGDGNVFVVGTFSDSLTVRGEELSGAGEEAMLIKLDERGELIWMRRIGGEGGDSVAGVVVDSTGNVYVSGSFEKELTLGEVTLTSRGGRDVLLASYDRDGDVRWAKSFGGAAHDLPFGLAISPSDELAVTGTLTGAASLDDVVIDAGDHDGFIVGLDTTGAVAWNTTFGGTRGDTAGEALAYDGEGRLHVSGFFFDTLRLSSTLEPLTGKGVRNTFVASFDGESATWSRAFVASQYATSRGIAPSTGGSVFVTGFFAPEMSFDDDTMVSAGQADIFLGRILPPSP